MNQPRLTTEDDQVITIPNNGELLMEETEAEQVNFFFSYMTCYISRINRAHWYLFTNRKCKKNLYIDNVFIL